MGGMSELFHQARAFLLSSCLAVLTTGSALSQIPLVHTRRRLRRILYVQFTNPGNYPPLQHSARMLVDAGWDVRVLGTESFGSSSLLRFPSHNRIQITTLRFFSGGFLQKLHYVWFCVRVIWIAIWWRGSWIYASDLTSYLPALLACLLTGRKVILHEHDSPPQKGNWFHNLLFFARKQLARRATAVVVPNHARAVTFRCQTGARSVSVVWNCPSLIEVAKTNRIAHEGFIIYYHGNLSPALLPLTVLEALQLLPEDVTLRVVGYETLGSVGYTRHIQETASRLNIAHRVDIRPPVSRLDLLKISSGADVGIALFPVATGSGDSYSGASNKVFDYLCCGIPVLITDCPEWNTFLDGVGCSLPCNPADPVSISQAVLTLYQDRALAQNMGRHGRKRILSGWNYETQFAPVLEILQSETP
jgi:glycosyltransferase involved in cell wall biosynthesis